MTSATACIALSDGSVFWGEGFGAEGVAAGELCFNTSMTGYQEIMTDPSYAGQIVTFTFPHIGNVGVTPEDDEAADLSALGMITRWLPTEPSNWRARQNLPEWLQARGRIGVGGVDTRRLTRMIRMKGAPHAAIAYAAAGDIDADEMIARARAFEGLEGADLAAGVSCGENYDWDGGAWTWPDGFGEGGGGKRVVAVDFGAKRNILRCLTQAGCDVVVVPASATAAEIRALEPAGLFLSNGPGDPAATGDYAVPMIREILETTDIPVFGICLGHQMLALALGGQTVKMNHGHHGANHPVKNVHTGEVSITSMNHGFAVDSASLPDGVEETHVSLFDGSNCGLRVKGRPVFSVQHHPEASPGPQDSLPLFRDFVSAIG